MKNINIILFTVLTIAYLIYAYFLKISDSTLTMMIVPTIYSVLSLILCLSDKRARIEKKQNIAFYLFWRIFIYDNRSFYYYEWKIKRG